ncbi:MAG: TonB-dependent receptor plug domain-containing protein, partial [Acidobacteriota bacterium]|nr:TonB-dependent receptor plug domain-containing protein [Acidobacteriota bacterium]
IFAGVESGVYELKIEKQGFGKYEKTDVKISAEDTSLEIAVALKIGTVSAEVTVENSAESVNTVEAGSSPPVANVERKTIERLPLATKRVDEAIPLVPGVIRSSRGEISIDGATEQQSSFRVNGLNVADPASGNFRLNLPVDAVESVQVFRHPYSAEFGQFTGGVTNIETRRGGDKLHFEINDFLPDFRFVGGKIVGIQDDAPHVNFNGPIIKDRLFFSQSLGYTISKQPVRGLFFPNNETISEAQSYFTQIDQILSPRHSQVFTFGYFPERQSFVGLDFFRPRSVTPNYKQKDFVGTIRDNFAFENGSLLQTSFSYKKFDANVWGQGDADQNLTVSGENGNYFATQMRRSARFEFFETYDFPALEFFGGMHNIKTGFNFTSVSNRMNFAARPVNIIRADGSLAERATFEAAPQFSITNRTYTGFVQDRLVARPNLSFDFGVRIEDQRIASERNFAPRAGFAFSPFTGDKTVIRGGIGFFYDKVPLNIRGFGNYPARTVTVYGLDGQTIINRTRFENILVDSPALLAPLDFRTAKSETGFVPENLTWNLQIDQIVNSTFSLRANYTHSRTNRIYTVQPQTDFFGRSAIVLSPTGRASYDALELTAKLMLPKKQPFYLSYVRSKARGDLNDFNSYYGDFGVPIVRANQFSNLSTDVPNRFLAWGNISLPHKITASPILEWRSGFPYSVVDENQNFVGTRNANSRRFPKFFSLDAELSKDFQITKKYAIRLSVRGFNLTKHFNPRNVRNNTGDLAFGAFINNYRRYFTGGFDIIF